MDAIADLLDRQAIIDVTIAYTWALDTKDWDALDDVFLPDATADLGLPHTHIGRDAIKERISGALGPLDDSQHLIGNHDVRIDGDTATCRCYLHAQHVLHAAADEGTGGPLFVVAGRYEDRFVRTPEGWRIAYRTLITMWTAGNVAVVRRPH
ncbi:MAG: nuclear transport factor 2 family protein [Ilumatobacteraceae bacterium]|nr:nuclear transport factor 2 family protein [Ilumatobacteraceae bacterium]